MLNVRLDKDTEKTLKDYCEQKNVSKTTIVREALAMYFTKEHSATYPHTLGADLFGAAGSGNSDTSVNYKSKIKQKINEKHTH